MYLPEFPAPEASVASHTDTSQQPEGSEPSTSKLASRPGSLGGCSRSLVPVEERVPTKLWRFLEQMLRNLSSRCGSGSYREMGRLFILLSAACGSRVPGQRMRGAGPCQTSGPALQCTRRGGGGGFQGLMGHQAGWNTGAGAGAGAGPAGFQLCTRKGASRADEGNEGQSWGRRPGAET